MHKLKSMAPFGSATVAAVEHLNSELIMKARRIQEAGGSPSKSNGSPFLHVYM